MVKNSEASSSSELSGEHKDLLVMLASKSNQSRHLGALGEARQASIIAGEF